MSSNCLISVNSFVLVGSFIFFLFSGSMIIKGIYDKYIKKTKGIDIKAWIIGPLIFALLNLCFFIYSLNNTTTCETGPVLIAMAFIVLVEIVAGIGLSLM